MLRLGPVSGICIACFGSSPCRITLSTILSSQVISTLPSTQSSCATIPANKLAFVFTPPPIRVSRIARRARCVASSNVSPCTMILASRESKSVPTVHSGFSMSPDEDNHVSIRTPRPPGQVTSAGRIVPTDSRKPLAGSSAARRNWIAQP